MGAVKGKTHCMFLNCVRLMAAMCAFACTMHILRNQNAFMHTGIKICDFCQFVKLQPHCHNAMTPEQRSIKNGHFIS